MTPIPPIASRSRPGLPTAATARVSARRARAALRLLIATAALAAWPVHASQLVVQNLAQLIAKADVIVTGEVVRIRDGVERGLPYTEVTLNVRSSLKRELPANSSYTFRQYGLLHPRKLGDGRYLLQARIEGMPTWTVGEKVTTFMNKPSPATQMRTPVGLAQGKFTYSGSRTANSFDNRSLFTGVTARPGLLDANESAMLAQAEGPVDGAVFMGFVRRAIDGRWLERGLVQ